MSRDDVDVDALIRIGRQRRVVGASYATEKREIAYFDPALAKLARSLGKALPDQPLINIVGASADERQLLVIASSDTQPGMVYLFDQTAKTLEPLLPVRKELEDRPMGQMRPITYPAKDGTMIPAYLTLPPGPDGKNLPAIVMPHGGPSARDEWGFDWLVQYFIAKGYAVLQPNYRGSAGYGENWYGKNGFKAWEVAIGDVNDAGRWLVSEGIAKPDKLAIVGWSYGGYAALQSQVLDPTLFKAVAAIAPVTDLGYITSDAQDYTNSRLVKEFVGTGPHIDAGSPRRHADRFAAPVALFHGTLDLNVAVRHSQDMAKALKSAGKSVMYREYKDLQHGLDDSSVRASMLADIGKFLDTSMESK
jgi:dipeptidyl aminopeptidase/acylaminoacyl peptidase